MILKLTGNVSMSSEETIVKPQCDIKDLTLYFIGACKWECGGERPNIVMKEMEHRRKNDVTISYYS